MICQTLLCLLVVIFYLTHKALKKMSQYFENKGIKTPPSPVFFIGNILKTVMGIKHFKDVVLEDYNSHPDERYVGMFVYFRPSVLLRDPELIKQIAIRDFDYFCDRFASVEESDDLLFGNGLFGLKCPKWRDVRATLSPAFTSYKIKRMFEFLRECGENLSLHYLEQWNLPQNKGKEYLDIELKDVFARYTNDVIATCAFGLKVNSFKENDNEFYLKLKETTDISNLRYLKYIFMVAMPKLAKFLKINIVNQKLEDFYRRLVCDTIRMREEQNIIRHDMIHLMMEFKQGKLNHELLEDNNDAGFATVHESSIGRRNIRRDLTDNDIVAQVITFFTAGFETSSTLLSFICHELALQPEIQRRLQREIEKVHETNNGNVSYSSLNDMSYLDMIVSEGMRKWPSALVGDRMCTKPYNLQSPNNKSTEFLKLNIGSCIWIPIYALHHDPQYFENPNKFDPERFNEENRRKIKPFTYLPFGVGPRNCIGSRFALMTVKVALYTLLLHFDLIVTEKTQDPIELEITSLTYKAKYGFWIGLKERNI